MIRISLNAALLASMLAMAAPAAVSPAAAQEQREDPIVVEGSKATAMRDLRGVLRLVDGYVARFDDSFCPMVMGLDAGLTQRIEARIRGNARRAGLTVLEDCKPTAIAIFIERPRELMGALRDRRPDQFRSRAGSRTITAMIRRPQPFYAWRAVRQRTPDGRDAGAVINFVQASRIMSPARYDIVASYVIIDIERIVGATTTQLADFTTMQLLNNAGEASAKPPAGSILGLFAGAEPANAAAEMNAFDRGLLAGLYDPGLQNLYAPAQRGRIAARVAKEKRAAADPER